MLAEEGRALDDFEIILALYEPRRRRLPPLPGGTGHHRWTCMPWAMRQFAGEARTPQMIREEVARFAEEIVHPLL